MRTNFGFQHLTKSLDPPRDMSIKWQNAPFITAFHLLAIPVFFTFSWQNVFALVIGNWIVGGLGVGIGWHRLLTHRSFSAPKWLEYALTILGTMSVQDRPDIWVATHRMHHAFAETEKDPHSTRSGFLWAHIGWIVWGVKDGNDMVKLKRYIPDLLQDKGQVLISRFSLVPVMISVPILFLIGGWTMVVWGVVARVVVGWHSTWLVNSLSHLYGKRPHATNDLSTNNWFVALLSLGEGWHNNHHAFPTSARHGMNLYEF